MYFYESHLGGFYFSETELDYDMLYCEQCGDSDNLIGYAETKEDALKLLIDDDYDDEAKYEIEEFVEEAFSGEDD